ncbi:MAG: hypothetical protein FD164_534 [Nitrospirae bacterium]|nr:MAG: hypothetical protein FD164_534 [Nitrospirota bacterium]
MHVLFVSDCTGKSKKRSASLLDRYAVRIASDAWITPITEEALNEIYTALRRSATRFTAVACYRNEGMKQMRLLWTVGSSSVFGHNGAYAVATRTKKYSPELFVRIISLVAQIAALAHDIGKATKHFQDDKLKSSAIVRDKTRHEWISAQVFRALRENDFLWTAAWEKVKADPEKESRALFAAQGLTYSLSTALDAVEMAIATHHLLFGPSSEKLGETPTPESHANRKIGEGTAETLYSPKDSLCPATISRLKHCTERLLNQSGERSTTYWRAAAIIARAAVILADHAISAKEYKHENRKYEHCKLYANSRKPSGDFAHKKGKQSRREMNQPLDYHLTEVARYAANAVRYYFDHSLPGLSQESVDKILRPSGNPAFAWQDKAVAYLQELSQLKVPTLIFNVASTGAGKTRMNAKTVAALATDRPVRFAASFNLRTLTLQTHDAYRNQLGLPEKEIACLIGDKYIRSQHTRDDEIGNDIQNDWDLVYETEEADTLVEMPDWLKELSGDQNKLESLVGVPVLISTVDYLVNAGEPGTQGHHARALLRVASSDIILDEVDSYDPDAVVAILRLVQMAGMFGRNVVASSATLAEPVAKALCKAYYSGVAMRAALKERAITPRIVFIDNMCDPSHIQKETAQDAYNAYCERIRMLVDKTLNTQSVYRKAMYVDVKQGSGNALEAFYDAVCTASHELHEFNRWKYPNTGKHVSFGLVRVANIPQCIYLAQRVAKEHKNIHVCAYHAADFALRRFLKEQALDRLLNRTKSNKNILDDPDVRKRVEKAEDDDVIFIVVATPVEEIGRDHDFDWAVIEPSSVHSIVQTAGRVNRHRLKEVSEPNIAILQWNVRALKNDKGLIFTRPGHEREQFIYGTGDERMAQNLLDNTSIITAALRFGSNGQKCLFAQKDDASINAMLETPLAVLLENSTKELQWASQWFYNRYPLRDKDDNKVLFRYELDNNIFSQYEITNIKEWVPKGTDIIKGIHGKRPNAWLCPSIEDLISHSEDQRNFEFEISIQRKELVNFTIEFDFDFGAKKGR